MDIRKLVICCAGFITTYSYAQNHKPKNVIFMIGDGMGISYLNAYREFKDDPKTYKVETTAFDRIISGLVSTKTYKFEDDKTFTSMITDSAAAATTYSTSYKTKVGYLGMDAQNKPIETFFEFAKKNNMKTGVSVTASIVHATPAAFITHYGGRDDYNAIANSYLDDKPDGQFKYDVLFGGGQNFFDRSDRNLIDELKRNKFTVLQEKKDLDQKLNGKVVGLFAKDGLTSVLGSDQTRPSLSDMTTKAIDLLKDQNKGFFLLVESSQIDWAGHENDIVKIIYEMQEFEDTLQKVLKFAEVEKNTLVVVVADHETGGLSIGTNNSKNYNMKILSEVKKSPDLIIEAIKNGANPVEELQRNLPMEKLIPEDKVELEKMSKDYLSKKTEESLKSLRKQILLSMDRLTGIAWTTHGHTNADVAIMAYGPGAENFRGFMDNTEIAPILKKLLAK